MKASSYIFHIAKTNILKKGQRTWLSLISILLSTAIIFTSLTLFLNVFTFSKNVNYEQLGNFHFACFIEQQEVKKSTRYHLSKDIGTNLYGKNDSTSYNWRQFDLEDENVLPFYLKDGVFPKTASEVLIPSTWNVSVGQTISLNKSVINEIVESEHLYHLHKDSFEIDQSSNQSYKVVGVYEPIDNYKNNTGDLDVVYSILPQANYLNSVYYIIDNQIQLSDSYSFFLSRFNVNDANVFSNLDVISSDSVNNYLKDTTVILIMFAIIGAIGSAVSLISVHNVLIISDKDRKKELGLLKSIGATPTEIKNLITIELIFLGVVGSLMGLVLGVGISYVVLNLFIEKLYIDFSFKMVLNPIIILVSMAAGVALMYVSGMKAYEKYIYSTAISDLKEFNYDYAEPVKPKNKRHRMFAWKMFSIYNGRMKKQTKNITQSFTLFLFTCILFMSTFLSNAIYVNRYSSKGYDFELQNSLTFEGKSTTNPNVSLSIYDKEKQNAFLPEYIYAERIMLPKVTETFFLTREDAYDATLLDSYKVTQSALPYDTQKDDKGIVWSNTYHFPVALDNYQLDELRPYLVEGSLDNLTFNQVISIQSKSHRLGTQLCTNLKVGDEVCWDGITNRKTVAAIVHLPDEAYDQGLHFNYEDYPRVMAFSMDAAIAAQKGNDMNEHIYIKLKNSTASSAMLDIIDEIINNTNSFDTYTCDPVALTVETNRFATFIIEALLYPLFFMLFIISLLNLNNVFIGNVHLKRGDISVMKSVGMTNAQLSLLFTFEYVEGYLNAALISIAVFVPVALLEGIIGVPSVYEFGSNIIGTLMLGLMFLGVLLIIPLITMSLKRIKKILPIENLKNVD